ncbi:hypothetical protein CEP54_008784 [Fusarium duplospermum]|uniref:Uncharacterized protein n=1 Tax=Fusarium duplospermum TaxID=1325734 RepID=A0A428PTU5_9HYPO|nr:hypothetical protein CEP54_008784 [Fusarium duplospermum]
MWPSSPRPTIRSPAFTSHLSRRRTSLSTQVQKRPGARFRGKTLDWLASIPHAVDPVRHGQGKEALMGTF